MDAAPSTTSSTSTPTSKRHSTTIKRPSATSSSRRTPTAADEYVQTWLEAQWEGDKGLLDYAKMLIIPDFAVMNPWSDEFHPGWAIVEVLGIIPWTKVTKLATLAKLGRHGDEMADAVRLFDEGADILGDAGRISDDVAGASDDLLGASDELAAVGRRDRRRRWRRPVPPGEGRSSGRRPTRRRAHAGDGRAADPGRPDLGGDPSRPCPTPRRNSSAPAPTASWTRGSRPTATSWYDPRAATASSRRSPSSKAANEATRGTRGSIRPDVILERRVVDEDGVTSWEVVEVADLKTGNAGISASWQRKVDDWLAPNNTTEIRPQSPVPVPE